MILKINTYILPSRPIRVSSGLSLVWYNRDCTKRKSIEEEIRNSIAGGSKESRV